MDVNASRGEPQALPAGPEGQLSPAQIAALQAENHELRAELEQIKGERTRLLDRQHRMMDLLGTASADHLVHDLRNVLNERELLRTLAEDQLE